MPGAGSMDHMVKTIVNNAKLLRKKSMFKKERSFLQSNKEDYSTPEVGIPSEKVAPALLKKIRSTTIDERRKRNRQFTILLLFIIPFVTYLGYLFLNNFSFGFADLDNYGSDLPKEQISLVAKNENYQYFLNDGDRWLRERHYKNAVFQYKKALEIFPTEYAAHYRLALAYSYRCQYDFEDCEEGMEIIETLEKTYPNSEELQKVKAVFEHWGV